MGLRHEKVVMALKREISSVIHNQLKDPRLGFVTIMRVDLSADLRYARVYFSVLGGENEQKTTLKVLKNAKVFIRYLIAQRINLRFVPEITFKLDRSAEYSIKIQEEIDKLKEEDEYKKSHRLHKGT
jgi:ribosome-binding factor A